MAPPATYADGRNRSPPSSSASIGSGPDQTTVGRVSLPAISRIV